MSSKDIVIRMMLENNIPIDREHYLNVAFMGEVPEITAEMEAELPPELQERAKK